MKKNTSRKLKEFDLDAPTLSKIERHSFRMQTRFLTASVERHFRTFSNSTGIWKVLVEVVPSVTRARSIVLLGVLTIQVVGNPGSYLNSKRGERELLALDWLLTGARVGFVEYGWSTELLNEAVAAVIAENFHNAWIWKKSVYNPCRSATVDVVIDHGDTEVKIVAIFRSVGSEKTIVSTLCSTLPTEFSFVPCLGSLKWIDDSTIELRSRSGVDSWTASM